MSSSARSFERSYRGNFIQGTFVPVTTERGTVKSANPADLNAPVVDFPFAYEPVAEATRAAARAFGSWRRVAESGRAEALRRFREALAGARDTLATAITWETGKPLWDSRSEVDDSIALVDAAVESLLACAKELPVSHRGQSGSIRRFPRGVVAVIPPGSEPVYGALSHAAPALLYGNTVVMKAPKNTPYVGQLLAETASRAELPKGVFNLLQGDAEVAQRLTGDPDVQVIAFTGHFEAALRIRKQIAGDPSKTIIAETGGKSSTVVFADAKLALAVKDALLASYRTSGQLWLSTHRIAVESSVFDEFLDRFHQLAKRCRIDDPFTEGDRTSFFGPLLTDGMLENYLRFQGIAVREGCEEVMRGKLLERPAKGHFVSPSIHVAKSFEAKSIYQSSEIYGPNVCFYRFRAVEEAAALLAQSPYGLAGSAYTASRASFEALREEAMVGVLHWNRPTTARAFALAPVGLRRSGSQRPMGRAAVDQCTYPVSSWMAPEPVEPDIPAFPTAG
jgi:succinylglutamic semialdehyde dehydrogenase